jgi:hypothetical protein
VISDIFGIKKKVTAGNVPALQRGENEKYENKSKERETAEVDQEYEQLNNVARHHQIWWGGEGGGEMEAKSM